MIFYQIWNEAQSMTWRTCQYSKLVISGTLCISMLSGEDFRMKIQNANITPGNSNQQRKANTVRRDSMNNSIQPGEINESKKSEVIAFVKNPGVHDTANNFGHWLSFIANISSFITPSLLALPCFWHILVSRPPPHFGTCLCSNCWDQIPRTCNVFTRLFTSNTPW